MAINLPELQRSVPIIENGDKPSFAFSLWWNKVVKALKIAFNAIDDSIVAIEAALTAAGIALDAAEAAQAAADSVGKVSKLSGSGISGATIVASDAGADVTVTISAHTRVYSDGTSVSVNSGVLTGLAYNTTYYIYYDDPTFAGGAVVYQTTTTQATASQTNARHLVGQVFTPSAGQPDEDGLRPQPPGFGNLQ